MGIKNRKEKAGKIQNKEWLFLCDEFVRYERALGKKSTRKIPYILKPFFVYLNQYGYEFCDINDKKAAEYQTYLATLNNEDGSIHYSPVAVFDMINAAKNFYTFLKTKGIVYTNPFKSIKYIKRKNRVPRNILKEDQMDTFLTTLKNFWKEKYLWHRRNLYKVHVIAELMYATGLRISEVAHLEVDDIDIDARIVWVRVGKGGRDRKAFLNEYCAKILEIYITRMRKYVNKNKTSRKLFGVKDGRNLDSMLNGWLKKMGKRCGIERFTAHLFRHALGFHLLKRGCDMRYIQLILGHETIETTRIYTKVEKTDLRNELDTYHPRKIKHSKERQ